MAARGFRVYGTITDKDTGKGIEGLVVEALNKDFAHDEQLGTAVTDDKGRFELLYDRKDAREAYLDPKPDLYLRVKTAAGQVVLTTRNKIRYRAGGTEAFVLKVPGHAAGGHLRRGVERPVVEVSVWDHQDNPLPKATVSLRPLEGKTKKAIALKYDRVRGVFRTPTPKPGRYQLRATAAGLQADTRGITIGLGSDPQAVILGKRDLPALYRGGVRVPFDPPKNLLAATVTPGADEKRLYVEADRLGLSLEKVAESIHRDNVRVFRFAGARSRSERWKIQEALAKVPGVARVGPVVKLTPRGVSYLTNELVVKFKHTVADDQAPALLRRFGLTVVRAIPYANAFLARGADPADFDLLRTAERLVETGNVEYAEPNLVTTSEDDQVVPTDYQYPEQWHHGLIGLPLAWEILQDNLAPDVTFGSPDVVIAIMDRGIQSQTVAGVVQPLHPDFTGTLSDGSNKMYAFFDFANMVANNDNPPNNHGMGCSGIATALPNNASVVAGVNEGIAGAAGNSRAMGLIRPAGAAEIRYSDAYIWMAGFNPGWTADGVNYAVGTVFPAVPSPGADVISNSFGESVGLPISGLMSDTFDFLTTYGRGGRGCCLFFSVGNGGGAMGNQRPWASYAKTMAVAASTLANDGVTEVRANYSNFGNAVDFCAPSSSGGIHNPPQGYGAISADFVGLGDLIGQPVSQTTLTAAAAAGANVVLSVAATAGLAVGQRLQVQAPGTVGAESAPITNVNAGLSQVTVASLLNAHPNGTAVATGARDYTVNFGGTSSATPLTAGVAALMLSANPDLSWVRVRQILRDTAVQIDLTQANVNGQWIDLDGDAVVDFSQWYGFGRINAQVAVQTAVDLLGLTPEEDIDTWILENALDIGDVPSPPPFSPDVWVRNTDPALDNPADVTTHQSPIRGQTNWVYANIRNRGAVDSANVYARISITRWGGTQYVYPDDFIPTNPPGTAPAVPLAPGTYLIDEVLIPSVPAAGVVTINVPWDPAIIPPEEVEIDGVTYSWADSCLLVEVSPHDGPTPTGNHTWDNNNLCQRNITIVDPADDEDDFAMAFVIGNRANAARRLDVRIDRNRLPAGVDLFFDYVDATARDWVLQHTDELRRGEVAPSLCEVTLLQDVRARFVCRGSGTSSVATLPAKTPLVVPGCCKDVGTRKYVLRPVLTREKRVAFAVPVTTRAFFPVWRKGSDHQILALRGIGLRKLAKGEYLIDVYQVALDGTLEGMVNFVIRKR